MDDFTVIDLLQQSSRIAFMVTSFNYPTASDLLLIQKRVALLADAEKLARKTAKTPDLTPYVPRIAMLEYRDLQSEHNERFLLARNAVLRLKMDRWIKVS